MYQEKWYTQLELEAKTEMYVRMYAASWALTKARLATNVFYLRFSADSFLLNGNNCTITRDPSEHALAPKYSFSEVFRSGRQVKLKKHLKVASFKAV